MPVESSLPIKRGADLTDDLTTTIRNILTEEDVEGLIQAGAPLDEYQSEAVAIAHRIARLPLAVTEESVLGVVADECVRSFGPFDAVQLARRRETYGRVAHRILMVLT